MNQYSLDQATQLHPDLWSIQNLMLQDEINEFLSKISIEQHWQKVDLQERLNREMVTWQQNGLVDWLWVKLNQLDFSRFGLTFRTALIWRDHEGYTIGNHIDNDRVVAAMQIYLSPTFPELGTWFLDKIEIPFVQNTGYLMHNRNKLEHGTKRSVPPGYTRLSFYALFDQKTS